VLAHLGTRETAFVLASRAPYGKIAAVARERGNVGNAYTFLDLTALGRQEDWEEPKGRVAPVRGGDPTFTS